MSALHRAGNLFALLAICAVAAYAGFAATDVVLDASRGKPRAARLSSGESVEAVFVGASTCSASRSSTLAGRVKAALSLLRDSAAAAGVGFAAIGVSLDWGPSDGIRWLRGIADFDEVIAGRNWVNLAAIDYLWRDSAAVPALPQLIVAARTIRAESTRVVASEPRRVLRLLGEGAIRRWVEAHASRPSAGQ
jgi:hypothetical protein